MAFEILNDADKRSFYDQYGEEGLKEGGPGAGGMDPSDLFSHLFGGGGFGGSAFCFCFRFWGQDSFCFAFVLWTRNADVRVCFFV
jgi:hypothetical protein